MKIFIWTTKGYLNKTSLLNIMILCLYIYAKALMWLGNIFAGFGAAYLNKSEAETNSKAENKSSYFQSYKSVLNSKSSEESMVNIWHIL